MFRSGQEWEENNFHALARTQTLQSRSYFGKFGADVNMLIFSSKSWHQRTQNSSTEARRNEIPWLPETFLGDLWRAKGGRIKWRHMAAWSYSSEDNQESPDSFHREVERLQVGCFSIPSASREQVEFLATVESTFCFCPTEVCFLTVLFLLPLSFCSAWATWEAILPEVKPAEIAICLEDEKWLEIPVKKREKSIKMMESTSNSSHLLVSSKNKPIRPAGTAIVTITAAKTRTTPAACTTWHTCKIDRERDDFVMFSNCIHMCTTGTTSLGIKRKSIVYQHRTCLGPGQQTSGGCIQLLTNSGIACTSLSEHVPVLPSVNKLDYTAACFSACTRSPFHSLGNSSLSQTEFFQTQWRRWHRWSWPEKSFLLTSPA